MKPLILLLIILGVTTSAHAQYFSQGAIVFVKKDGRELRPEPTTFAGSRAFGNITTLDSLVAIRMSRDGTFVEVQHEDTTGWLYARHVISASWLNYKRGRPQRLEERFGKRIADRILDGDIWIGMTRAMARESLGSPEDVNRSRGSWGAREQWVYPNGTYLYFNDRKLESWQNF